MVLISAGKVINSMIVERKSAASPIAISTFRPNATGISCREHILGRILSQLKAYFVGSARESLSGPVLNFTVQVVRYNLYSKIQNYATLRCVGPKLI